MIGYGEWEVEGLDFNQILSHPIFYDDKLGILIHLHDPFISFVPLYRTLSIPKQIKSPYDFQAYYISHLSDAREACLLLSVSYDLKTLAVGVDDQLYLVEISEEPGAKGEKNIIASYEKDSRILGVEFLRRCGEFNLVVCHSKGVEFCTTRGRSPSTGGKRGWKGSPRFTAFDFRSETLAIGEKQGSRVLFFRLTGENSRPESPTFSIDLAAAGVPRALFGSGGRGPCRGFSLDYRFLCFEAPQGGARLQLANLYGKLYLVVEDLESGDVVVVGASGPGGQVWKWTKTQSKGDESADILSLSFDSTPSTSISSTSAQLTASTPQSVISVESLLLANCSSIDLTRIADLSGSSDFEFFRPGLSLVQNTPLLPPSNPLCSLTRLSIGGFPR